MPGIKKDIERFRKKLNKFIQDAERPIGQAVRTVTRKIFRASQRQVPVDSGVLRSSGEVKFEGKGADTTGKISYGTDYAIYVHERLDLHHSGKTKAKYLTDPFSELAPTLPEEIKKAIKRAAARSKKGKK